MATKAGTLHEGWGLSFPKRVAHLIGMLLSRSSNEPHPTDGLVARAELGRETGVRC